MPGRVDSAASRLSLKFIAVRPWEPSVARLLHFSRKGCDQLRHRALALDTHRRVHEASQKVDETAYSSVMYKSIGGASTVHGIDTFVV